MDLNKVPSCWDEVTVQQYLDLRKANPDPLYFYSVLFGVTLEELRLVSVSTFDLAKSITDQFTDTPIDSDRPMEFEFQGVKYKVPQNLEFEQIGVYTDWLSIAAKADAHEFIPGALAMLCRPEGEEYDKAKAVEREKLFHQLPITTAYSIATFFLQKQNELEESIIQTVNKIMKPTLRMRLSISIYRASDFTLRFFTWLLRIFFGFLRSGAKLLVRFFTICFSRGGKGRRQKK